MAYATVDQLSARLPQVDSAADADLLDLCLTSATGIIRDALRARLADPTFDFGDYGAATTKLVAAYGESALTLPPHAAGSVTLIEYRSQSSSLTWTAFALDWDEEDGRLYRLGDWGRGIYRITAVWGYGPPPDAIVELCLELAVNIWRSRDKGGMTEIVGVEGGGSVRAIAGLNTQQEAILNNVAAQYQQIAV